MFKKVLESLKKYLESLKEPPLKVKKHLIRLAVIKFYEDLDNEYLDNLNKKKIIPIYYEIKNGELLEYKGRNTRAQRVKPKTNYQLEAAKFIPKAKKVSPGYKKKRQAKIDDLAQRLKKNDQKKKRRRRSF